MDPHLGLGLGIGIEIGSPSAHKIYQGKHDSICSTDDFLTFMSGAGPRRCNEYLREEDEKLSVFWYPTEANFGTGASTFTSTTISPISASVINNPPPPPPPPSESIQDKISLFLQSLQCVGDDVLVQFWAATRTMSGQIMLSVSEQPFGVDQLYKGFCRYRYACILQSYRVKDICELGPVGRVFTCGSREGCSNIGCYSLEEFPLKNYAIQHCGIVGYCALPLCDVSPYECECIGVVEVLSLRTSRTGWWLEFSVEEPGLAIPYHSDECEENLPDSLGKMYLWVPNLRRKRGLPLVQVWVPCICDAPREVSVTYDHNTCSFSNAPPSSRITQLSCGFASVDQNTQYWVFLSVGKSGCSSVKNGRTWVGRAHLLNKLCFFKDTSQFSISDYPLVHLTRSSGLAACFAIPLQLIHPDLPPFILEVFLPPQRNCDGNLGPVLKSLLSTVSQEVSKLNVAFELKQGEEFCVELSHSDDDNFVYFDVHSSGGTMNSGKVSENGGRDELRKEHPVLTHHPDAQNRAETSNLKGVSTNFDTQIFTSDAIRDEQLEVENLGGNEVHSYEALGGEREKQQFPSSHRPLNLKASDDPNTQDTADTSIQVRTNGELEITLDVITEYFGRNLVDAAKELGVSRSTLKRRCRHFGIKKWPSHKRIKVNHIQPIPRLPTKSVGGGGEVIQESEIGRPPNNNSKGKEAAAANSINTSAKGAANDEIDHSYTMIIKATFRDDIVKFPFNSNSRIEELRRELDKRFELKAERFKIKYEEDGDWILISCSEDLSIHMNTLKASGQTTMNLSVFPTT